MAINRVSAPFPRTSRFGAYDVVGFQTEADADNFRDCIVAAKAARVAVTVM